MVFLAGLLDLVLLPCFLAGAAFLASALAGLAFEAFGWVGILPALARILVANGFLVGSIINSNFSLDEPPSIGAPLYFSTALEALRAVLKTIVAIPLD